MTSFADSERLARPPTRGPWSYLAWLVARQGRRVVLGAVLGTLWMVGLVVPPFLLSRAVDALTGAEPSTVLVWSAALVATGTFLAVLGIWRHRTMTQVRMDAAFRTVSEVTAQAVRLGVALGRRSRTGEVVAIGIGDVWTIGRSLTVTGPGVGAVLAYLVIAVLLFRVSPPLAVVVVAGVPALALLLGPALGRLQRAGTEYRGQQGLLTGRIIDIIGGLSVLNGLGGKQLYADRFRQQSQQLQRHGYRVGRVTGIIQATGMALPTLFIAVVVWMAARLAVTGEISVGELVAVFGYAAVLVVPVSNFIEGAVDINRALVASRRVTDFLALQREGDTGTRSAPSEGDLVDEQSQITIRSRTYTAIATARQADAVALIDRLGGFQPGTNWNGTPLADITPAVVRGQLLVADNDAALFTGTLATVVAGRHPVDEGAVLEALQVAAGDDLVQAEGLERRIASGGSNVSGGQRQRIRLARAVRADPTVLLAVDPTSAVDAATEERIVERLVKARRGRTTVIATTSALMLAAADEVHLVVGGRCVATGTHTRLLRDVPAYAALVLRGESPGRSAVDGQGG